MTDAVRASLVLAVLAAAILLGIIALARFAPRLPFFGICYGLLAVLLCLASFTGVRRWLGLSAPALTGTILIGSLLVSVLLWYVQSLRQSPDRLTLTGVVLESTDRALRIGAASDSLDVRLTPVNQQASGWMLQLQPTTGGNFAVAAIAGVDELGIRGPGLPRSSQKLGRVPLGPEGIDATIPHGGRFRLRLAPAAGYGGAIEWEGGRIALGDKDTAIRGRIQRELRGGRRLADLPHDSLPSSDAGEYLHARLEREPIEVLGLTLAAPRVSITSLNPQAIGISPNPFDSLTVRAGDTVEVHAGGGQWAFAVGLGQAGGELGGTRVVRIVRDRAARGWSLPTRAECGTWTALGHRCLLISTTRPEFPVPWIDLGGIGLDTARYAVVATFEAGQTNTLVTPRKIYDLGADPVFVAAREVGSARETKAGYLLSVVAPYRDRDRSALGVAALLAGVLGIPLLLLTRGRRLPGGRRPSDAMFVALAGVVLLLTIRLTLGIRVAYAPPYYERAGITSIGMWLGFSAALMILASGEQVAIMLRRLRLTMVGTPCAGPAGEVAANDPVTNAALCVWLILVLLAQRTYPGSGFGLALGAVITSIVLLLPVWVRNGVRAASPGLTIERRLMLAAAGIGGLVIALKSPVPVAGLLMIAAAGAGTRSLLGKGSWRAAVAAAAIAIALFAMALLGLAQAVVTTSRFVALIGVFILTVESGQLLRSLVSAGQLPSPKTFFLCMGLPILMLSLLAMFDFGLGLIFLAPIVLTLLVSVPPSLLISRSGLAAAGMMMAILFFMVSILFPATGDLDRAMGAQEYSEAFSSVGNVAVKLARSFPLTSGPTTRATVRSMAGSRPDLLELALAEAGPSEAVFAARAALDQVSGARTHAAAGWTGAGLGSGFRPETGLAVPIAVAENTMSAFILSDHGLIGALAVVLAYAAMILAVLCWMSTIPVGAKTDRRVTSATGALAWITLPASYVALSNLGLVPLTGQNMPFFGLNAWSDVALALGLSLSLILALSSGPEHE